MYTELSDVAEAEGKTIKPGGITLALLSGQLVIAFTDETFLTLGVERGYDGDDWVFRQALDLENFGADNLVKSGIITEEKRVQKVKELVEERQRGHAAAARRQYELLKAKFEGGQS